ncbi:hypothetical protein DYE48_19665 [Halobacillus trueperi]|uniref:Uncharacterized protein n=1 Tax=Halobacillus trueperi TaxID=156205 RepID=A0A3E0IZL2_9BACI|nr:hypothetical protein DYE48_19665 [Halobacillus trueperi]
MVEKQNQNRPTTQTVLYVLDFTEDEFYDEKFLELLHRIEGVAMYEKVPLGKKRDLKPRREINSPSKNEKDFLRILDYRLQEK